ncbi:MAG TPA: hypothetical protein VGJ22_09475 [Anaerolineales bacterium]|jgi:hypothetical protein
MLLLSFLALLPRCVLGFLLIHRIWRSADTKDLLIKAFLAGPAGIGISSLAGFFWIWAGLDLRLYMFFESIGTLLLLAALLWRHKVALLERLRQARLSLSKVDSLWLGILALALLIFAGESWNYQLQFPHGAWDAWNHWNVVARFIYRGGSHWTGTFLRTGDHPDYPLLLAISNADTWELLSRETIRAPLTFAFFFGMCQAGLLFGLIYKLSSQIPHAALAATLVLAHALLAIWTTAMYADTPLAFYFLASGGFTPLYLAGRDKSLPILAGFIAGLAAWTKNEGLVFVISSTLVWLWIGRTEKMAFRYFLLGLVLPVLAIVPFKLFLAPDNDIFTGSRDLIALLLEPARYRAILTSSVSTFQHMDGSPVIILIGILVYGIIAGKTHRPARGFAEIIFIVLVQWIAYFVIFVITPLSPGWHVQSSIGRLYLHMMPLLMLAFFLWIKSPLELRSANDAADTYASRH